ISEVLGAAAASQHACAFLSGHVEITADGLQLIIRNQWSDTRVRLERIAELPALRQISEPVLEGAKYGFLNDHAAGERAILACAEEGAARDVLGRNVEIGVVEDNGRVLATELELDLLAVLDRFALHCATNGVRTGERDGLDRLVRDQHVTDL